VESKGRPELKGRLGRVLAVEVSAGEALLLVVEGARSFPPFSTETETVTGVFADQRSVSGGDRAGERRGDGSVPSEDAPHLPPL
jgi:hypothetical protein